MFHQASIYHALFVESLKRECDRLSISDVKRQDYSEFPVGAIRSSSVNRWLEHIWDGSRLSASTSQWQLSFTPFGDCAASCSGAV